MFHLFNNNDKKIKNAKAKLAEDLKTKGILFLLEKLTSSDLVSPLIDPKDSISSDDYESHYAIVEASCITNTEFKPILLEKLNTPNRELRAKVYYCLSHLCGNTGDLELFQILMKDLRDEKDNGCISSILIGLDKLEKPENCNIDPIKKIAKERNIDLKVQAIFALRFAKHPEVEDFLLELFLETKDSHIKDMICFPLGSLGGDKSIHQLNEAIKKTRDLALRDSIKETIAEIQQRIRN